MKRKYKAICPTCDHKILLKFRERNGFIFTLAGICKTCGDTIAINLHRDGEPTGFPFILKKGDGDEI
jgi:ssDNA-binding Zn-finger/Zn-ribbon topoisomerase 1